MQRCLLFTAICTAFLVSARSDLAFADYKSGLEAYNAGTYEQALSEWEKAALEGDKRAQHALGLLLQSGRGTKADIAQAFKWYEAAAQQGFPPALNNLAMLYAEGLGVEKDQSKAVTYWVQAAEAGNATAQFNLGVQYLLGSGVPANKKKTVELWTRAAKSKHVQAQYNLGLLLDRGDGIDKDEKQAIYWITQAAQKGLIEAQLDLAEFYQTGHGVPQDFDQSKIWLEKAASAGSQKAKQILAERLESSASPNITKSTAADSEKMPTQTQSPTKPEDAIVEPSSSEATQQNAHSAPTNEGHNNQDDAVLEASSGSDELIHKAGSLETELPNNGKGEGKKPEEVAQLTDEAKNQSTSEPHTEESIKEDTAPAETDASIPDDAKSKATENFSTKEDTLEAQSSSENEANKSTAPDEEEPTAGLNQAEIPVAETLSPQQKIFQIWLDERGTEQSAQTQFTNLKLQFRPDLDKLGLNVRPFISASGTVYRIYAGPYATLKDAQDMCNKIQARVSGQFCRTVIN